MLGRKSLHVDPFSTKSFAAIFRLREDGYLNIEAYKLLFQFMCVWKDKCMLTLQNDLGTDLLCGK